MELLSAPSNTTKEIWTLGGADCSLKLDHKVIAITKLGAHLTWDEKSYSLSFVWCVR